MGKKVFNYIVISIGVIIVLVSIIGCSVKLFYPCLYKKEISLSGEKYGIEKELIASMIFCESKYKKDAVSKKGAIGLMQLMPSTAKSFYSGDEELDKEVLMRPEVNIDVGTRYVKYLFDKYKDESIVLACYNAGESVARPWIKEGALDKESITYKETYNYINKVQKMKKYYKIYF